MLGSLFSVYVCFKGCLCIGIGVDWGEGYLVVLKCVGEFVCVLLK